MYKPKKRKQKCHRTPHTPPQEFYLVCCVVLSWLVQLATRTTTTTVCLDHHQHHEHHRTPPSPPRPPPQPPPTAALRTTPIPPPRQQFNGRCRPYASKSASKAALRRMQLTLHATHPTPLTALGASKMSAWSVKTRHAPSRHCRDMRGSRVIRLQPSMIMSTPPPSAQPGPALAPAPPRRQPR